MGTTESLSVTLGQIICFWKLKCWVELSWIWLFNVTINTISVIYVTAHRCAGGLKKKLGLRSGSQRHRHFVGFFNVPVLAPTRDHPFYTVIPKCEAKSKICTPKKGGRQKLCNELTEFIRKPGYFMLRPYEVGRGTWAICPLWLNFHQQLHS